MFIEDCCLENLNDTLKTAFDKGEWAGSQCYKRTENPYSFGTAKHEWWDSGWSNSLDELCGT